jgi:alanine racemase
METVMSSRPCWVEIQTRAFEDNYRLLQTIAPPGVELLAIIKADAYGHSLAACAPAAVRAGARWLGVTSVEEGMAARSLCSTARILVMGGIFPGQEPAVLEHALTPVVWEPDQLRALETAARAAGCQPGSVGFHLEIDTGMSRQGACGSQMALLLAALSSESPLRVEAVMTHLYASDEVDGVATTEQLAQLDAAIEQIQRTACRPEWLSVGASAALLAGEAQIISTLAARRGLKPMLRPGIALYGVTPRFVPPFPPGQEPGRVAAAREKLHPVLTWKTRVVSLRDIAPCTEVGYNGTFVATEPMRLALIPAGYADGLDRRLGNRFSLLVRGERAPLVGRISMDQAVLDVTEIAGAAPGDEVVILGAQGRQTITAYDHADAAGTIPWEVFTRIGQRVPRIEVRT